MGRRNGSDAPGCESDWSRRSRNVRTSCAVLAVLGGTRYDTRFDPPHSKTFGPETEVMADSTSLPLSMASPGQIRGHFPALQRRLHGQPVAYFDGPGGTQVPRRVVEAM